MYIRVISNRKKLITLIIIYYVKKIILTLFLLIFINGCYYDVDPPIIKVEPKVGTNNILLISKEFKYFGTDFRSGKKSWELIAEKSIVYKDNKTDLENIEIKFFKKGKITSSLKGSNGILYPKENKAEITGNVILENYENNTKIFSSRLMWDGNKRLIYNSNSDKTTIVSPKATLKGTGIRTTPDVYPIELENVEAVVQ